MFQPDAIGDPFHSHELSLRQVREGHKVTVITWNRHRYQGSPSKLVGDYFTVNRLPGFSLSLDGAITEYPYLPTLPKAIRSLKFNILHAHSHLFMTTLLAVKEANKLGKPSVVTVHGVLAKRSSAVNLAQYAYLYTVASWIFKKTSRVICLTKSDSREVTRYGCPPEKIRIIPNAVDTELFKPTKSPNEDNLIVWVGRFVPEKGLKYLVKAAKIVTDKRSDAKFVLVGDGPLKPEIMRLTHQSGLDGRIIFTGVIDQEGVANVLAKASIFVFLSIKEGFPKVLIEAMACGKPVVASNIAGVNDVIENMRHGILVQPKEPETLAETIIKLLDDKGLRQKLGSRARQSVLERYNWSTVISQIENVFSEVLEEREQIARCSPPKA